MHYKNGREAKNGDVVVMVPEFGIPKVGILYDAQAGNDYCNGKLAIPSVNDPMPNLKECLHVDDVPGLAKVAKAVVPIFLAVIAAVLLSPALAFAQSAASAAPAQPVWVTILLGLAPLLLGGLLALRPLLKLAAFLDAHAQDKNASALAKTAYLGAESAAKSLDHFLETTGNDAVDLIDPSKRAAALQHIENAAKTQALPALSDAVSSMGAGWLTGAASQAIDAAIKAAPAVAVAAPVKVAAPVP